MNKKLLILLGLSAYTMAMPHSLKRRLAQAGSNLDTDVATTSVIDTPVVDTPVVDTPVIDTPVVDTPVIDTPVVDTPVVDTPVVDTPVVDTPVVVPTQPVVTPPKGNSGSGSILDCNCELPSVGSGFPAAGQGVYNGYGNGAQVSQATSVVTVPDTAYTSQCESACCACNAGVHASQAAATRTRHYDITGAITVAETVEYTEAGNASEQSQGHSQKASACINSNENGSGSAPGGDCITVCVPGSSNNSTGGNGASL